MKKTLLTLGIVGWFSGVIAQSTNMELRRSDMSYPGQSFAYSTDTSVAISNAFQEAGKGKRWDLQNLDINSSYTTNFLAPDANNGGNQVPNCNLVLQESDAPDEYTYIEATGDHVRALN
ncbi:MAG: hypothetical protein LPK45_01080, partial [Bacteroidota bacterium]|nr:hypothetical protein [Bacteroidota bacterium]MDX5429621.1 hypothetical protein [Bacteroidota bacterium]MDX5468405.1 hypothetical protein [Bacteroidota bacterium]